MVHHDLTEKILGCCFEVINELGTGFLESVYRKAVLVALKEHGLEAQEEVSIKVHYHNNPVGNFYADIIVANTVLVELKVCKAHAQENSAQVINYLKATKIPVGILVNFGNKHLEYRRLHC